MMFLLLLCLATANAGIVRREEKFQRYNEDTMEAWEPGDMNVSSNVLKKFIQNILEKVPLEFNSIVKSQEALIIEIVECNSKVGEGKEACKVCTQDKCRGSQSPSFLDYIQMITPYNYLKEPLDQMTKTIPDVVHFLGHGITSFIEEMESFVIHAGETVERGFKDASRRSLGNFFSDIGKFTAHFGTGINHIGTGITHIGTGITDIGTGFNHFGVKRRRREIDADTRHCVDGCIACQPLLFERTGMINKVCGPHLLIAETNLMAKVKRVMDIYNTIIDTANPVISKIEIYDSPWNKETQSDNTIFVTVVLKGTTVRYQSEYGLSTVDTIRQLANEYWDKWN